MSNKPDSTAAEQYLQERFPTLIGQEQVAIIMTEFAQSEAQHFAEWCSANTWHYSRTNDNWWTGYKRPDGNIGPLIYSTTSELYNGPYAKWKEEIGK